MTIINNSAIAKETALRVHNPIFYVPKPLTSGPLAGFKAYFGLPGRDPTLPQNQMKVYALQEDNSAVPLEQPVIGSAGGVPIYQGSPVGLALAGSYSMAILDSNGVQTYYIPNVDGFNLQGFSGVIAEESKTITGSTTLTYDIISTTTSSFYISEDATGSTFKGKYLKKEIDYIAISPTQITLTSLPANGFVILGREMDPTGQIIPVSSGASSLFVFDLILDAKESNLQSGDTLTINGGIVIGDGLGNNKYITVLGQPDTDDGVNIINLNNGNQIKVIENTFKLAKYAEVTTTDTTIAGVLNIDLNKGNVHKITLTESISSIVFVNANPDTALTTTVTIEITQSASTLYTVSFAGTIWAGGLVPSMTATLGAMDKYAFIKSGGSASWAGVTTGQDFK